MFGAGIALLLISRMNSGVAEDDHDALFSVAGLILAAMECVFFLVMVIFGAYLGNGIVSELEREQPADSNRDSDATSLACTSNDALAVPKQIDKRLAKAKSCQ